LKKIYQVNLEKSKQERGSVIMKRINFLVICTAIIFVIFSGSKIAAKKGPVKITFWYPLEKNKQYFDEAIANFEKANPNIKVEAQDLSSLLGDVDIKLNAAKLSGAYPDVFAAYLVFIGQRGSRGEFAPLDGYIAKMKDKDKKDIFDTAFQVGKYKGKTLGIGYNPSPMVMVYRKDLFKEAGLDPEKPPANWKELRDYAIKLTKKDSNGNLIQAGLDIPLSDLSSGYFETFMRQNGSKVVDEKKQIPSFNDGGAIGALKFLVDLKDKAGVFPFRTGRPEEFPFIQGKSAMSGFNLSWLSNLLKDKPELADKIGIIPPLQQKAKAAFCGYRLYTIGAGSKHKNESWQFIQFMISKEQIQKQFQQLNIPVIRNSLQQDYISKNILHKDILEYVKYGKGKPVVPWAVLFNKYLNQAYEAAMNHVKTPEDALKEAQKDLEAELARMK
jgi:ABC-type glycerol-3-phosphate transport system substrate-binding protein